MMIVGQETIKDNIYAYATFAAHMFPKSLMLIGEVGSGRHMISHKIADHFGLRYMEISDIFKKELIDNLYQEVTPTVYVIDASIVDHKKQNILLKLLEDPILSSFIVIIAEGPEAVLPTVLNRCQVWTLQKYSRDELLNFTQDERILAVATTPGMVEKYKSIDLDSYNELCTKIVDSVKLAAWSNLFAVVEKFNFDDDGLKLFIPLLINKFKERIFEGEKLYKQYKLTLKFSNDSKVKNVDEKRLFEEYLFALKRSFE